MTILLKADLHLHTVNSGHGLNTWLEFVNEAKNRGVEIIGFTEHGPNSTGARHDGYFDVQERMPDQYEGIRIFKGCELNVADGKRGIDLSVNQLKKQTLLSVGFHSNSPNFPTQKERTEKLISILKNHPYIHIVVHPYLEDIDMETLARYTCKNNFLLELNVSTFKYKITDKILNRIKIMVEIVKSLGGIFIVGSDAHIITDLGDDKEFKEYMNVLGLKKDDIINNYPNGLMAYIQEKNKLLQFA